ncbi:MAG: hypothetical protein CV087_16105 [Candidatus Brocadia sp. WS118]|nr:MAG: hypothetical protein CV087_16105 [Candidatus Brocadia sp. WS118]
MRNWQKFEQLWKNIKAESDQDKRDQSFLNLINHLLADIVWENDRIQEMITRDPLTVKDFLIEYLNMADQIYRFFTIANPFLVIEFKNSEFLKDVEEVQRRLKEMQSKTKRWREKHAEFLQNQERLEKAEQEYDSLEEEAARFQEIKQKATPENLKKLREKVNSLKQASKKYKDEIETLEKLNHSLSAECGVFEKTLSSLNQQSQNNIKQWMELIKRLVSTLNEEWHALDRRFVAKSNQTKQLTQQWQQKVKEYQQVENRCREMIEKLDNCMEALNHVSEVEQANRNLYAVHFAADAQTRKRMQEAYKAHWSKYNGNIEKAPEVTMLPGLQKLHECSERISADLKLLDEGLGELIQLSKSLRDGIRRLTEAGQSQKVS